MTTLLLEDLYEDAGDMALATARLDVIGFLDRAGKHAAVFFSVCQCNECERDPRAEALGVKTRWTFLGVKDGEGRGGVSHSVCPGQVMAMRAEMAARSACAAPGKVVDESPDGFVHVAAMSNATVVLSMATEVHTMTNVMSPRAARGLARSLEHAADAAERGRKES